MAGPVGQGMDHFARERDQAHGRPTRCGSALLPLLGTSGDQPQVMFLGLVVGDSISFAAALGIQIACID